MQNTHAILISYAYIFLVLGLATLYAGKGKRDAETSRKLIHIFVGNWVFITPMFTAWWAVMVVPFTFLIVNTLSRKHKIFSAMEREDNGYGTIYYAASMLVLPTAAYFLKWPTLSFTGLLIMAYGDGLAAIVGRRWGKRRPFSFAPEKSLAGTAVVASSAFVITLVSLLVLQGRGNLRVVSVPAVLFIALLTAFLSAFIELAGKEGCDNLSLPVGAGVFATLCLQYGNAGLYAYLLMCVVILWLAFRWKAISADGAVAALLTAQTLYAMGGVWVGLSLLTFFLLGSVASKMKNARKINAGKLQAPGSTRNWKQVLSNSLPACALVWAAENTQFPELILPALAVFSAAAADTFSSEYGMMFSGRVFNIINGKPLARGLSGGVTWVGLLAGLFGSVLLALFAVPQYGLRGLVFCASLGFAGTLIDSALGSLLQAKYAGPAGRLQEVPSFEGELVISGFPMVTNNAVNLITLTIVAALGVLLLGLRF